MSYFTSLSEETRLLDLFREYPHLFEPLVEFHERLLREPSPYSVGERELLAAYVSALNACHYCTGVHAATAQRFDVDGELLLELLRDVNSASIRENLKPVFAYVRKLTEAPSQIGREDAVPIFEAGWDDRALCDAVAICSLFNCMNRLVEGLGFSSNHDFFEKSSERLADGGYRALLED